MTNSIRTIAVAICRNGDRILVERGYDRGRALNFYRPIGGEIQFGEGAADAVVREWREEFGIELAEPAWLGVLENRFTYEGQRGHEIVFVFSAKLQVPAAASFETLEATDEEGLRHTAVWVSLEALQRGPTPLYPHGLLGLLRDSRVDSI